MTFKLPSFMTEKIVYTNMVYSGILKFNFEPTTFRLKLNKITHNRYSGPRVELMSLDDPIHSQKQKKYF